MIIKLSTFVFFTLLGCKCSRMSYSTHQVLIISNQETSKFVWCNLNCEGVIPFTSLNNVLKYR